MIGHKTLLKTPTGVLLQSLEESPPLSAASQMT